MYSLDLACYQDAIANLGTCSWDITGEQPQIDDGCDVTIDSFDNATCMAVNTPDCPNGTTFNTNTCACDTDDPCPSGVYDECGVCGGSGIAAGTCDCEGTLPAIWYADADMDGLGDPNNSTESCSEPMGYVSNNNDTDDTTPANPEDIPTLSQWGLIALGLILMSITTVSIIQNKFSLAQSNRTRSTSSIIPYFNAALFRRMFLKSVPIMLLIFVLISFIEDGWFVRNLVGTILSTGIIVYLLHFITLSEWFKNGQEK